MTIQAVLLRDPPQLGISVFMSIAGSVVPQSMDWYPLPHPTLTAADAKLRDLHLSRLHEWLIQAGDATPRVLATADVQQRPTWALSS